ncbi:MAG: alpha/beta fold hydrolase [Verrucomicrobiae bacterium]|nr:alpha/beta fold hydrolase [Verrucomicrobiae bacterium]
MIHALHGNLGSPADWDALGLPDLRAVDLWEWQERWPGISLEEFGAAFSEEVAKIDPEPVLLGYSLGGRLALQAMMARPDLWKAAILVSTHPGLTDEDEKASRRESDAKWARRARKDEWGDFLASWNEQGVIRGQSTPEGQMKLETRRESVSRAFESWSLGGQRAIEESREEFPFPILSVAGERDEKFVRLLERFRRLGDRVDMVLVPDCGHRVPMEASERLGEVIRDWLGNRRGDFQSPAPDLPGD